MVPRIYRAIDEIFVGDAEGLTEAQVRQIASPDADATTIILTDHPACSRVHATPDLACAQFKERYPSESDLRKRDKIGYRYPRGGSPAPSPSPSPSPSPPPSPSPSLPAWE